MSEGTTSQEKQSVSELVIHESMTEREAYFLLSLCHYANDPWFDDWAYAVDAYWTHLDY